MRLPPRKRFGQHFLRDDQVIDAIIRALSPQPDDHLVEIGPGHGALTLPILNLVSYLEIIELDRDLVRQWQDRQGQFPGLIIHQGDALEFDFALLKQDKRQLRIFGNLPYNISTPLIFHLLKSVSVISDMLFMVQKEVAERLVSPPRNKTYGRLSVMVQYYCEMHRLLEVPPNAFFPPPKVESSIIRLVPFKTQSYTANDLSLFTEVVRLAFNQRRKTLRNSLKSLVPDALWDILPVSPQSRAETLNVKDYVTMSNILCAHQIKV